MKGYVPDPASMRNPFRDYPRNLVCPCASGKKFKKCCYLKAPLAIAKGPKGDECANAIRGIKRAYKAKRNGP